MCGGSGSTGSGLHFASDYFEQLYEYAVHLIETGEGVRRQPDGRRDPRVSRHAHRAGPGEPVSRPVGRGEPRPVRAHARRASSRTARTSCARRSTWPRRTSTCAIRCSTGSAARITTGPATRGASTRCTTSRTRRRTRSSTITHSLCTLEFEDHRPLYDWLIDNLPVPSQPRQIEFARLNLTYTVMSKRRLLELVQEGHVTGWDDPRMPTIVGMRRRGYTPEAIRDVLRSHRRRQARERRRRRAARARRARGSEPARAARDGRRSIRCAS